MTAALWRVAAALATFVAVASTPVFAAAAPASAATSDDVEFSRDGGATWSDAAPTSLFGAGFLAVPGDLLETSLLIRSTRDTPTVAMVCDGPVVSPRMLSEPPTVPLLVRFTPGWSAM